MGCSIGLDGLDSAIFFSHSSYDQIWEKAIHEATQETHLDPITDDNILESEMTHLENCIELENIFIMYKEILNLCRFCFRFLIDDYQWQRQARIVRLKW